MPKKGLLRDFLPNIKLNEKQETLFLTETSTLDTTTAEIFMAETPKTSSYDFSIKMEIGRSQHWHLFLIPLGSFSITRCFQTACNSPLCLKQIGSARQGMKRWRAPCQKRPAQLTSMTHHPAARPSSLQPYAGSSEQFLPPRHKTSGSFSQQNIKYKKINYLRHSFSCNLQKNIFTVFTQHMHIHYTWSRNVI